MAVMIVAMMMMMMMLRVEREDELGVGDVGEVESVSVQGRSESGCVASDGRVRVQFGKRYRLRVIFQFRHFHGCTPPLEFAVWVVLVFPSYQYCALCSTVVLFPPFSFSSFDFRCIYRTDKVESNRTPIVECSQYCHIR